MDHLRYCFCFMFWFSGLEACGTLAAQPGIEPTPPALGGKVFTTGLPWWQTICLQCRRYRRCGFDPWVGKIPWRRKWLPTAVFLPGEFHGQRSLAGYSPWGRKGSDTTEWLSISLPSPHLENRRVGFQKKRD